MAEGADVSVLIPEGFPVIRSLGIFPGTEAFLKVGKAFAQTGTYFRQSARTEKQEADHDKQNQFPETGHGIDALFFRSELCGPFKGIAGESGDGSSRYSHVVLDS